MATTASLLRSILRWLRAGYPDRAPGPDRVPLLALLRSAPLTDDQIQEVVRRIAANPRTRQPIEQEQIAQAIKEATQHDAEPENIDRVAATLSAAGWPVAGRTS